MSRSADTHTPMPIVSHVLMRGARVRGMSDAGSRVIAALAALAALAVLFAAQTITRLEHGASGDALQSVSPATSFAALHAEPAYRPALAPRSAARWPSGTDVTSLVRLQNAWPATFERQFAIAPVIGLGESGPVRGYDATAPPALS